MTDFVPFKAARTDGFKCAAIEIANKCHHSSLIRSWSCTFLRHEKSQCNNGALWLTLCLLRLLELLASNVQLSKSQTNVITPVSFVVDRARFCDMKEEVKNEEPFKMHKHKAPAMMKWNSYKNIFCCYIPLNIEYRLIHVNRTGHFLIRVSHFFFQIPIQSHPPLISTAGFQKVNFSNVVFRSSKCCNPFEWGSKGPNRSKYHQNRP